MLLGDRLRIVDHTEKHWVDLSKQRDGKKRDFDAEVTGCS